MHVRKALLCFIAATVTLAAADPPYAGKWKMNPAKSDFGESTVTYSQLPSGEFESTADGQSYKFRLDGKDYPDPFGDTAAWKSIDARTWETTWKLKGKVLFVDTLKLSADGQALTVNSKGVKPNGESIDDTVTLQRVSGGPGLPGKWKTKNLKSASPNVVELAPSGADGLVYRVLDMNMTCDAKLDGGYYPCSGPTVGPDWTLAWLKASPRSVEWGLQINGKPMFKGAFTVSADGKTLTETGGATATNENIRVVYDRQ
jgi:hypothetical protein